MPIYMKYEGISGSVTAVGYEKWIELESCQLGGSRNVANPTGQGNNREGGVPSISEIVVTKVQDSSSTGLFRESQRGSGRMVTVVFTRKDGSVYMKFELENAMISSYIVGDPDGTGKMVESMKLNFTKLTYKVAYEGQARIDAVSGGGYAMKKSPVD